MTASNREIENMVLEIVNRMEAEGLEMVPKSDIRDEIQGEVDIAIQELLRMGDLYSPRFGFLRATRKTV